MKKVWILFLQYSNRYNQECIADLKFFVKKNLPNFYCAWITVDNSISCDLEAKLSQDVYLISGDQSNWEFSGYDRGLKYIQQNLSWQPEDLVIIANDTFNRHYGKAYLNQYSPKSFKNLAGYFVSGYGDAYPEPVTLAGNSFQKWFRSSFIISNLKTLIRIGDFKIPFEKNSIFSENYPHFFNDSNLLSENYKTFIKSWLFDSSENNSFNHEWHSKTNITQENYVFLQNKARSILAEHYFSLRVQSDKSILQHYIN